MIKTSLLIYFWKIKYVIKLQLPNDMFTFTNIVGEKKLN